MQMSGNTVLITGGAAGIGFELASRLTALGNTVMITSRDQARLDAARSRLPALRTFVLDISDPADIARLSEEVTAVAPALNILINNAGIMRTINLNESPADVAALTSEVDTNLSGTIRMVSLFLPHLSRQRSAAIVNVSSGAAFMPIPITPIYCASKAGLHSYTLSLRAQLKHTPVRVYELMPPTTQTPLLDSFDNRDVKGASIMPVEKMVDVAIKGLQADRWEIRPGQTNQLRWMSRIAPRFIFTQLSKSVDGMLARSAAGRE